MTHRWGFDLSTSAVRLMRREAGHWQEIASEPIEGDDLDGRLRTLVEQVPEPRIVDVFLPRDQILYTDIPVSDPARAVDEIEREMDGRTPYALADMEIDWEIGADNTARVAAIARETLTEAEAFADQCGLGVARFSSLPEIEDFPRQPDFGIGNAGDIAPDQEVEEETAPEDTSFASVRTDDAAPDATDQEDAPEDTPDETAPVVRVEDDAPVMQVVEEREAPLDPGAPLPTTPGAPRVRTDLSLPEGGGRAAASLTPPEPLDPYGKSEPEPADRMRRLGYGLAAVLTIGIGVVVWSILPSSQDTGQAVVPDPAPVAVAPPPVLSDTPPEAAAGIEITFSAPQTSPPATLAAFSGEREFIAPAPGALSEVVAQSGTRPDALPPLAPPPTAENRPPVVLAALSEGPSESGLTFEVPTPPVTRPGSVGLPGVQSFAPGIAPPPGEAPDYVIPEPPVVASLPETPVEDAVTPTEAGPTVVGDPDTIGAPVVAPTVQDTDLAALPDDTEALPLDEDEGTPVEDLAALPPETTETDLTPRAEDETPLADSDVETDATGTETALVEPEADALASAPETDAPDLPQPTAFAAALPDTPPAPRPSDFVADAEQPSLGGRTASELAGIRPPPRPASAQRVAEEQLGRTPPSALAVATSPDPRARPSDMTTIVAAARTERQRQQLAALQTANTSNAVRAALSENEAAEAEADATAEASNPRNSPRLAIPSNADVARQATIEDAIRLNRLNLVGVYGAPSDRRALVRLPNGRYVKVKIGDQVDGGTIAAISEDALQYRKGGRTYELNMPQG